MTKAIASALAISLGIYPASNTFAATYNVDGAHVQAVEGTYSPDRIVFIADKAAGACVSGMGLTFTPPGSNDTQKSASASAVMSSLLSAKLTNSTVTFGGDDVGCKVYYIQSR